MTEKRVGYLRRSWRFVWGLITATRRAIANLIFLVLVVIIVAAIIGEEKFTVPENSVLLLAPTGKVVDQRSFIDPLTSLLDPEVLSAETPLYDLVDVVQQATEDPRIVALALDLDELRHIDISSTRELGAALNAFSAANKPVIAMGDNFDQHQYLLASYADEVYVHSMGGVGIQGYGVYPPYFSELLQRLKVDVHVFRVGEYKSAVEPFIRDDMSIEAKKNNLRWLNSLWGNYTSSVALNRDLDAQSIDDYVNNYDLALEKVEGNAALGALNRGLVDQIMGRDQMLSHIAELVGRADTEDLFVHFYDYLDHIDGALSVSEPVASDIIAVVVAEGMIVDGDQPPGTVGGDSVAALLREAREDEQVKAVVLRINSPGGSAFASEIIREQVMLTQQAGKPVVASMGNMAASGGYWIAAGADEIWAQATTITGSIGIFGVFPSIHRTLANWGIHSDGVGTTRLADAFRADRPLSDIGSNAMQSMIEHGYQRFVQLVAESRGMSVEAVESVAQGRVWSGEDALAIGLVDSLGGLQEAVDAAAGLAALSEYDIVWLSDESWLDAGLWQRFLGAGTEVLARHLKSGLLQGVKMPWLDAAVELPVLNDPRGLYLHCMECAAQ
jgi:protease-4